MDKKVLLGNLSAISFITILFTPLDSEIWKGFIMIGVLLGLIWWFKE